MPLKKKTEAEKRAQRKYDEVHKAEFKSYHLKYRRGKNDAVIKKLDSVANKQGYIEALILEDIKKNG